MPDEGKLAKVMRVITIVSAMFAAIVVVTAFARLETQLGELKKIAASQSTVIKLADAIDALQNKLDRIKIDAEGTIHATACSVNDSKSHFGPYGDGGVILRLVDKFGMTLEIRCDNRIAELLMSPEGDQRPSVHLYCANAESDKRK